MNAEQLNTIARGILQLTGLSPEDIDMQVKEQNKQKTKKILKNQPQRRAPSLPSKPPVKPEAPVDLKSLTAEQMYGKANVDRAVNTARNMNPTAGLGKGGLLRAGVGQTLLSLLIDPASDLISDNTIKPLLETISGQELPSAKDVRTKGPKKATNDLKAEQASRPLETSVSSTSRKSQLSNIPPAEAQPGSPSYVGPSSQQAAAPAAIPTGSGNQTAPTAPARPDYNSMSEMERLKIWAMTNRKMIESVGTKQQLQILQRALGGDVNQQLRKDGQATYNRGSA